MLLTVGACSGIAVDTPLGVNADASVVSPGTEVTGEVIYPDGDITVTLTMDPATPVRPGDREQGSTHEAIPCDYDDSSHTYACDTQGLEQSRYVVAVTDAAQPGEGTQTVSVVVTAIAGYDPTVGDFGKGPEGYVFFTSGTVTPIPLTGWMPHGHVRVEVRNDGGPIVAHETLALNASGIAVFRLPHRLRDAGLRIFVTDGLWEADYPLLSD